MAIWDWFSTPKTVEKGIGIIEKVTDGIVAGIDKAWYTEEEKAEASQKAVETIIEMWKTLATENSEQSKARRVIAMAILKVYFTLLLMGVVVYGFDPDYAAFIFKIVKEISVLVAGVQFIYFGPHQISKIWKKGSE
jgi:hypothetical protein